MRLSRGGLIRLCILTVFFLSWQASSEDSGKIQFRELRAQKPAKASLIPSELVAKVKADIDTEISEKEFLLSSVYIFDEHGLIDRPSKITTLIGGGTVDLEPILPVGKGKFTIRIEVLESRDEPIVPDKVYFVPALSKTEEGQEVHCGRFFDVTQFFHSTLSKDPGFETYISEGIYASALLGSFVFVKVDKESKKAYLANLNFVDDRYFSDRCMKD